MSLLNAFWELFLNQLNLSGILLLGGSGKRFSPSFPKQLLKLSGKSLYLYALESFLKSSLFQEIILVCHSNWISSIELDIKPYEDLFPSTTIRIIPGGQTRQESSYKGIINACHDYVVIHDGVRPFVSEKILQENVKALKTFKAVDTCIPSQDTLIKKRNEHLIDFIPDRKEFLRGQTPQSFQKELILRAHQKALENKITDATDDCQLVLPLGEAVYIVEGSEKNIKITTSLDLFFAEQLLKANVFNLDNNINGSIEGKTYVVTGASGGIGQEICKLLEQENAMAIKLSLSSKDYPVDLSNSHAVSKVFKELQAKHKTFDGLINCIGYLKVSPFRSLSHEEISAQISKNFTAIAYACQLCPLEKSSHIVNLASSSFSKGRKNYAIYSAMKAALVNFSQALAEEHPDLFINTVVPPRTNTPMRHKNFPGEDLSTLLDPKQVARKIITILKSSSLSGMTIEIN